MAPRTKRQKAVRFQKRDLNTSQYIASSPAFVVPEGKSQLK